MNQKQKQQKVAVMLTLAVIVSVLVLPLTQAVLNQNEQESENKASFLISTFTAANRSVAETISNIQAKDKAVPQESLDAYGEAQVLGNQSMTKNQAGNFSEAIALAMQALEKLKQVLTGMQGTIDEATTQQEASYQQTVNLQNVIDRNYELLHRLENMTASAANRGTNMSAVKQKLTAIKANLDSAVSSLNQGNLRQAQAELNEAKTLIDGLTDYFESLAVTLKIEKVAAYVAVAEQRLETLTQEVESVSNQLSTSARAAASTAITQAQESLTRATQYLNSQQISQAITELKTVKANEDTITSYVNAVSPTLNSSRSSTSNVNSSPSVKTVKP